MAKIAVDYSIMLLLASSCVLLRTWRINLGMIDSRGHGRGAVWFLGAASKFAGESNKVE